MDFCLLLTSGTYTTNPSNGRGCPRAREVGSKPLETSALGSLECSQKRFCFCPCTGKEGHVGKGRAHGLWGQTTLQPVVISFKMVSVGI